MDFKELWEEMEKAKKECRHGCITCRHANPVLHRELIPVDCFAMKKRVEEIHGGCDMWKGFPEKEWGSYISNLQL